MVTSHQEHHYTICSCRLLSGQIILWHLLFRHIHKKYKWYIKKANLSWFIRAVCNTSIDSYRKSPPMYLTYVLVISFRVDFHLVPLGEGSQPSESELLDCIVSNVRSERCFISEETFKFFSVAFKNHHDFQHVTLHWYPLLVLCLRRAKPCGYHSSEIDRAVKFTQLLPFPRPK